MVGVGAIGASLAARLAPHCDLVGFDVFAAHAQRIDSEGLQLDGTNPVCVRLPCKHEIPALGDRTFDVMFFLTKSKATSAALHSLAHLVADDTLLVTLQNGMGNVEALLAGSVAPVARGVTMSAGRFIEPGRVELLISGDTWLGPVRGDTRRLEDLAQVMRAGGLVCHVTPDAMAAVWSKFVFNCVMNPVGALVGGNNAARYEVSEVRRLIDDMAAECTEVVRACGGSFAFDPMEFVHKVRRGELLRSKHAGSMALDIERGVETEIDELTGFIVREGQRLGVATPVCRTVVGLMKGLEYAAIQRRNDPLMTSKETT
jgi:2-dehydropantoate 2-reductase